MDSLKFQFSISPQEVDFTRHQTLMSLGSCLLNSAGFAAAQYGFGLEQLRERGLAWVLSRFHIEMRTAASVDDVITIETWPHECARLTSSRFFRIFNQSGELLGEATSLWSIINFETRRPVDLLETVNMQPYLCDKTVDAASPLRVEELHAEPIASHKVCYSDIDFNSHANSMKYVQWMLDTIDLQQFDGHHVASFDINYSREATSGEQVSVLCEHDQNSYHFDLKSAENRSYCKAKIVFAPNN